MYPEARTGSDLCAAFGVVWLPVASSTLTRFWGKVRLWREYRPGANDEDVIKDLKESCGLASFNMNSFWATELFMVVNALVFHNLIHYLNRTLLNKNTPKEHLKTLRPKWFIISAQLGNTGGMRILRLSMRNSKLKSRLIDFLEQIGKIPHTLNCITVESH
ncbi:MAG: hypothetical protein ACOX2W_00600 [Desulfomonilia bacterium]